MESISRSLLEVECAVRADRDALRLTRGALAEVAGLPDEDGLGRGAASAALRQLPQLDRRGPLGPADEEVLFCLHDHAHVVLLLLGTVQHHARGDERESLVPVVAAGELAQAAAGALQRVDLYPQADLLCPCSDRVASVDSEELA